MGTAGEEKGDQKECYKSFKISTKKMLRLPTCQENWIEPLILTQFALPDIFTQCLPPPFYFTNLLSLSSKQLKILDCTKWQNLICTHRDRRSERSQNSSYFNSVLGLRRFQLDLISSLIPNIIQRSAALPKNAQQTVHLIKWDLTKEDLQLSQLQIVDFASLPLTRQLASSAQFLTELHSAARVCYEIRRENWKI